MAQLKQISVRNRLLQALAAEDFTLIEPQLERIALPKGKALIEPQQPAEHVTFVETGIASVVALASEDRRVEVGIVGREGCAGHSVVLGVDRTPHQSFIQVEGHGYCIASSHLTRAIEESRTLHGLLLRYVQAFNVQVAATAASNGESVLGERIARWLLMCHDRIEGDELTLTHEFLSLMLAVRRASVTEALHVLEGAGIVRVKRAFISIQNRERLEEMADDSYGQPEAEYERLIPRPGSSGADHLRLVPGDGS
jgi:CRP-like cAMP-binding protein